MGNRKKIKKPWLRRKSGPTHPETGRVQFVQAPPDEKVVLKEVPAKVDGTVVGTALIYDDGTFGVIIDEDAPQWAKDKIEMTKQEYANYSIGTDNI